MICTMCKGKTKIEGWGKIQNATCYQCQGSGTVPDNSPDFKVVGEKVAPTPPEDKALTPPVPRTRAPKAD